MAPSGEMEATVDTRRGRLLALWGSESALVTMEGKEVGNTETILDLELLREEKADDLSDLLRLQARRELAGLGMALVSQNSAEAAEMTLQRSQLGQQTIDRLLVELEKAEKAEMGTADETNLYLKFKALVYLQPGTAKRFFDSPASPT